MIFPRFDNFVEYRIGWFWGQIVALMIITLICKVVSGTPWQIVEFIMETHTYWTLPLLPQRKAEKYFLVLWSQSFAKLWREGHGLLVLWTSLIWRLTVWKVWISADGNRMSNHDVAVRSFDNVYSSNMLLFHCTWYSFESWAELSRITNCSAWSKLKLRLWTKDEH